MFSYNLCLQKGNRVSNIVQKKKKLMVENDEDSK